MWWLTCWKATSEKASSNDRVERWNCRPRKDDMIPFLFNENRFSFFVADHLLVGQLCTNPKSDRSLLQGGTMKLSPEKKWHDSISVWGKPVFFFFFFFFVADDLLVGQLCTNPSSDRSLQLSLKVTQCSTSEIGDVPLYNSCSLPIQVMTTGQLPAPSKCKSGLPRITGTYPGWWKQSFRLRLWSLVWFQVRATSHLRSQLERVPWCAEECGDPMVQSGGRWQTLGVAAGLSAGPQVQRDPGLASEGELRLCTLFSLVIEAIGG